MSLTVLEFEDWESKISGYEEKGFYFLDLGGDFGNVETYCDRIIPLVNENPDIQFVTGPLFQNLFNEAKTNYLLTGIKAFLEETRDCLFWEKDFKRKIKVNYSLVYGL